jgi:hypothetical protein
MKILLACAVLAVLCVATRPARADACHGSGGGGDGGGGGPSGGESAAEPACSEVSDVVGRQRCGRFGETWAGTRACRLSPRRPASSRGACTPASARAA